MKQYLKYTGLVLLLPVLGMSGYFGSKWLFSNLFSIVGTNDLITLLIVVCTGTLYSTGVYFVLKRRIKKNTQSEEERMLQPFFDVSTADRSAFIAAIALLGSLPVIISGLAIARVQPVLHSIWFWIVLFIYALVTFIYGIFMSSRLRKFYEKKVLIIVPVLVFLFIILVFYTSVHLNLQFIIGIDSLVIISLSIIVLITGVKFLLMVNRNIFDKKAKAEEELNFASEVQKQFLQEQSVDNGLYSAFGTSVPARQVGGDFFSIDTTDNNRLIATVGDVSGHSFGAGLVMSMLSTSVQNHIHLGSSISKMFKNLNARLQKQTRRRMFASMGSLVLSPQKNELWNAGHMPVFHFQNKTLEMQDVYKSGPALGLSPRSEFSPLPFDIGNGDYLVLYSDGLVETRDSDNDIRDIRHFRDVCHRILQSAPEPETAARQILEETNRQDASPEPEDDLTIVVIRKNSDSREN